MVEDPVTAEAKLSAVRPPGAASSRQHSVLRQFLHVRRGTERIGANRVRGEIGVQVANVHDCAGSPHIRPHRPKAAILLPLNTAHSDRLAGWRPFHVKHCVHHPGAERSRPNPRS